MFAFEAPAQPAVTITDFVSGVDSFQFSSAAFGGGLVAGATPTVVTAASAASVSGPAGQGEFILDNAGPDAGTLFWDATGGSGSDAVAVAHLQGVTSVLPTDFHLV